MIEQHLAMALGTGGREKSREPRRPPRPARRIGLAVRAVARAAITAPSEGWLSTIERPFARQPANLPR